MHYLLYRGDGSEWARTRPNINLLLESIKYIFDNIMRAIESMATAAVAVEDFKHIFGRQHLAPRKFIVEITLNPILDFIICKHT